MQKTIKNFEQLKCCYIWQNHTSNKMKYLQIKNRPTETAPDITGDKNHDETKNKTATKNSH